MTDKLTAAEVEVIAESCRNWGKWGPDDVLGTLNYVTPEKVVRATSLVRTGQVVSCALPYDVNGPMNGSYGRNNPILYMMQDGLDALAGEQNHAPGLRWADDAIHMPLQSGTQWDALSHIFYNDKMYNDLGPELVTSRGAKVHGVENWRDSFVTRGILLDFPRVLGLDWLEPGHGIGAREIEHAAAELGVEIESGDILLLRTGHLARGKKNGWGDYAGGDAPGLNLSGAKWVFEHEIAAVAADTWGLEVRPNETDEIWQPLHVVLIVNAGMPFGEIFDFDRLSDACAADGKYEFLFVAPPLPFTGAVGGPLNPVAIK
ncbi:MAG TPA: cyclase family protein [Pseudolysinimonas sp.]|nr:cyclase family protein [Pseudolysinimonas sp.]